MVFQAYEHLFRRMPTSDSEQHRSFISHTYSATTNSYKCEICNKPSMTESQVSHHCGSKVHMSRIRQIRTMQANPTVKYCAALQTRIDQLGLVSWKTDVQVKLYWLLLHINVSERPNVVAMRSTAEETLVKYELLERISLLELAIWKAVCIVYTPSASTKTTTTTTTSSPSSSPKKGKSVGKKRALAASPSSTPSEANNLDYHSWQEWLRNGWKQAKPTMRQANEIGIIIKCVVPFLRPGANGTTRRVNLEIDPDELDDGDFEDN